VLKQAFHGETGFLFYPINLLTMESLNWFFTQAGPGIGAFFGAMAGGIIAFLANLLVQERKIKHEKNMYYLQNLTNEKAKEDLSKALYHQKYPIRSFEHLKRRVPLEESKLRELLIQLDTKVSKLDDGREGYYLKEREGEVFAKLKKQREDKAKNKQVDDTKGQ
jgi:gas vesicle protein